MRTPKIIFSFLLMVAFGGMFAFMGCDIIGTNTVPSITLNTTAGQVVLGNSVVITGKVTKGTQEIKDLVVLNDKEQKVADVPLNADGSFSYLGS